MNFAQYLCIFFVYENKFDEMSLTFVRHYYILMSDNNQGGVAGVSPRTGRPTLNPKEERLTVRIDKECSEILTSYCEKNSVNKGEAIRIGIKKLKDDISKK